jgi:hypothetical protein
VFDHPKRFFDQLDLLESPLVLWPLRRDNPVGRIDGAVPQPVGDPLIDLIGSKGGPLVPGVPWLAADPSLGLLLRSLGFGFNDVTGGRLRGIARMLPRRRQLGLQAGVFGFQFCDAGLELGVVFAQASQFLFQLARTSFAGKPAHG